MTPEQFVESIERLIAEGKDRDSLDFAKRFGLEVRPTLTAEQLDHVGGMLEGSIMLIQAREAGAAHRSARTA